MNEKKTILVTGSNGFIGSFFIKKYGAKYNIIGLDIKESVNKNLCMAQYTGDICDKELIASIFESFKIDIIIHMAAEKSLVICENNKTKAYDVNYTASISLADFAQAYNTKYIFISSDQVFDGSTAYSTENSVVNPINYYGKLKSMVESKIIEMDNVAICRTALVFGNIPDEQKEYFDSIKADENLAVQGFIVQQTKYCLENERRINLPDDEFVSPTHVSLLADQIDSVIQYDVNGIVHCCGNDRISRYEMGCAIAEHYSYGFEMIQPKGPVNLLRPKDVSLSCRKSENLLHMKFPNFRSMLNTYM